MLRPTTGFQAALLAAAGSILGCDATDPSPVSPSDSFPAASDDVHSNRLAEETSPYLLQHAGNPVDWHPWGKAALDLARETERPIFLSIGYSACHWCHVMERESFEDDETARVMNESFVCIKVDREERPDVDDIYMRAVMSMGQQGGWPLSVWLTPDGEPFYGGTYFPPVDRHGLPSFRRVLLHIANLWNTKREELTADARALVEHLRANEVAAARAWPADALQQAIVGMRRVFDAEWGGFGSAPKFPRPSDLRALIRASAARIEGAPAMLELTLDRMAQGGIYDHLSGGFHRYSVDERWLVPHFEKMLYDNALLARTYLAASQVTEQPRFEITARETLDYLLREMRDPQGGFHSATDADSEGEEGRFFVWTPAQVREVLGSEDALFFCAIYGVTTGGNFEHSTSILNLEQSLDLEAAARNMEGAALRERLRALRSKLYAARARRLPPQKDDKILADWNGLTIAAFADAYRVTGEPRYLAAAEGAVDFVFRELFQGAQWRRSWRASRAQHHALLSDHAYMLDGLLALFEAAPTEVTLDRANTVALRILDRFLDRDAGGFFATPKDGEQLIARFKDDHDGATPSPTAVAVLGLAKLYQVTGEERYRAAAEGALSLAASGVASAPQVHASFLLASEWLSPRATTIVITPGEGRAELIAAALKPGADATLVIAPDGAALPKVAILEGKLDRQDGVSRAYLCRGFVCVEPTTSAERLLSLRDQ